jgi:hypothetical protein
MFIIVCLTDGLAAWCCSKECRVSAGIEEQHDYVLEYSKTLGYRGLTEMVHRDIVREGDGMALNREWRLHMADFHNYNHPRYFVIGHFLLAGKRNV